MKVKEIMERAGINQTGRAIAYIKDGLEEIELFTKQNVVRGSLVSSTGTGISFENGETNYVSNNNTVTDYYNNGQAEETWDDVGLKVDSTNIHGGLDGTPDATPPTGWSSTLASGTLHYEKSGDNMRISAHSGAAIGITSKDAAITLIPGLQYGLACRYTTDDSDVVLAARLGTTATGNEISSVNLTNPTESTAEVYYASVIFTVPTGVTSGYLNLYTQLSANDKYIDVRSMYVFNPYCTIIDSNNRLSNFKSGMKILVNNSSNNDTDKSANTSLGYYTCNNVSTNGNAIQVSDTTRTSFNESAGESIIVRGQSINYMDIIKDKRFYELPDDMLKLIDVKIKNHRNGNDKYKSVERAIYAPSEQDGDNI